jgi:hypothetical protein
VGGPRPAGSRYAGPNPYTRRLKKPVTIRLDEATIAYFKDLAEEPELPYQSLVNLCVRDCAAQGRRLDLFWHTRKRRAV